ncbi:MULTISPECIES: hypothetical protein [Acinetobacter]|uniref:hypothetical protein n=1 Tax=Acinetobacter TaxID=469 RepID=UPI000B3D3162|nr:MULTISPECIES: hypothetical protein [Acinetobacter]AXY60389.1 hypothetical protein CDG61_10340 [Acinetobacter sp. WCHAc010052]WOE40299.1 hypothetical protein QSG87_10315 [Acinetobacter chinensis]
MLTFNSKSVLFTSLIGVILLLQACSKPAQEPAEQVEIKAAPKLSNDATTYANEAWKFINEVDAVVYAKKINEIDEKVRKPARKLSTDWRINVKMTDSVTEGKYALCRKALTSLDTWARETVENTGSVAHKQADYERDKAQCKDAIANPALGNTKPHTNLF